ncbi:MAG: isoprenylcysteine carboxylmethyltransferase family protein [Syntrophaceae bacterium]|nr:isoprenylcysteine carboxylmethyltransferase family protein [Syntrophaceae bacterium]
MTIFGIGLLLVATGGFSLGTVLLLESACGIKWSWTTAYPEILIPLGTIWAAIGFFFWVASIIGVRKAFYEMTLLTDGVYGLTRNPMYAAFILFLIPAVSLLMNDVLIVLASLVLYVVFRISIKKKEDYLLELFGDEYRRYAEQVPQLIPRLRQSHRE